jgi:hypothetical protein
MADKYVLDKAITPGTLYRSEPDAFFVVKAIGTNSTTKATLKVEGAVVAEIIDKIALPEGRDEEKFPPIDLGELYVVIPPDKVFEMTGESGKFMRLVGELWKLAPGEGMPAPFAGRFTEQPKRYITYQGGVNGIGASDEWAEGAEYTVIDFTSPAGERHVFNRYLYVRRTGVIEDAAIGAIAIRFYKDDKPLDIHDPNKEPIGIDTVNGHWYADTTSYLKPVDISGMPITLDPGRKLTIMARNISGAAIATSTGEEAKVEVYIVDEKVFV